MNPEQNGAAIEQMTPSMKARRGLVAQIQHRIDFIVGRAPAKILHDLDGALSLFERRLGREESR